MNGSKEFYMHKADSSNLKKLYLTSIKFEDNGFDSFFVQAQLRKAAEGNYRLAQRWLGILGLCKLIHLKEFYYQETMYNQTYDLGIEWLQKAADNGDIVSEFILAKCMQLGVGLEKNEPLAEAEFARLVPSITMDEIISVSILFDHVLSHEALRPKDLSHYCWSLRGVEGLAAA